MTISGGIEGDGERETRGEEVREELSGWKKEEAAMRAETEQRSEHADMVAIRYPRGVTALVWLDLTTGAIATTHAGLRDLLRRGIRGWGGRVVSSHDGPAFLSAVYDHFFLNGYPVQWLSLSGLTQAGNAYRV